MGRRHEQNTGFDWQQYVAPKSIELMEDVSKKFHETWDIKTFAASEGYLHRFKIALDWKI